jgi:hypothetical protein
MKIPTKSRLARAELTEEQEIELLLLSKEERKKLSREDKRFIQRIKNKHSAQRSRDERKVYITQLEEELGVLRAEV